MFRFFAVLILAISIAACSDDNSNDPAAVPNIPTEHDTLAARTPPAPGGSLPGYWQERGGTYSLTMQGYRGVYGKLYGTDLRVDGMRVWFQADEPGGGYRNLYNGTATGWAVGDSIVGWDMLYSGSPMEGYRYRLAAPISFVRVN